MELRIAGSRNTGGSAEDFPGEEPKIVFLDIDLPDGSGLDFLSEIKEIRPETIVVMITGNVDVKTTIAALRGGAHDFIAKPIHSGIPRYDP